MIAIAIAIKIESRGPVFFRQPRAGRGNTSFKLIKFRSMYIDAEQRKEELDELNEADDGVMFKIREDPRVTRVGRFIRRFSIDELPQLFNVLQGRDEPGRPATADLPRDRRPGEHWHLRRLELRPGLTGPWQVYGRSQSPFQEMVRFDYQYVAGWSLARDIEILLATLPAVLSGRGAYESSTQAAFTSLVGSMSRGELPAPPPQPRQRDRHLQCSREFRHPHLGRALRCWWVGTSWAMFAEGGEMQSDICPP